MQYIFKTLTRRLCAFNSMHSGLAVQPSFSILILMTTVMPNIQTAPQIAVDFKWLQVTLHV